MQTSGRAYYEKLHLQIGRAVEVLVSLELRIDERFGLNAPGLKDLRLAILACEELVGKLLTRLGGAVSLPSVSVVGGNESGNETVSIANVRPIIAAGVIYNRADAVNALREVSRYFRHHEPHSPVALLAERAASWAEMPLEKWLESVIKDDGTLRQLRELLDIRSA